MSKLKVDGERPTMRIVVQLDRAEMPRLYDELARFNKGVKRVSRLRLLAYEGLLFQLNLLPARDAPSKSPGGAEADDHAVLAGLFDPAIDEP